MVKYEDLEFKDLNYQSYLKINELLGLQREVSNPAHHDEMFFIIIHQAAELWFKSLLHEGAWLVQAFRSGSISRTLKVLRRITAVMDLQAQQIGLLATLTPVEFAGFRDLLRPASGFQSAQFREMEYTFGIRDEFFLKFFSHLPDVVARLKSIRSKPSIYDEALRAMANFGYPIPQELLDRDVQQNWVENEQLIQVIRSIYDDPAENYHWVLLFEAMLDFDEKVAKWRNHHILMVTRTIGNLSGTGGSSGVEFLKSRAGLRFFPELWSVRNLLGGTY